MSQRVNWVLDADIRSFFDSVDHEWLLRMVAHRIADPRVLRLIRLWLKAGILESGEWHETDRGTPQGAVIRPLLANIFLHYALDLWVHQWRRRHAHGRVTIVRYADDFVMGFEKVADARRMMFALKERLAGFGLHLHEGKTRLIEFGRFAASTRKARGDQRPETFAFLGFTHYCGPWPFSIAGSPACCAATTAISACRTTGGLSTPSGRMFGGSGSSACNGAARRTAAWAGSGSTR